MLLRVVSAASQHVVRRSLGVTPVVCQQTDPIQQLFVEKIREYAKKQKAQTDPDMLVDASSEQQKSFQDELDRIGRVYQVSKGENMKEFPKMDFKEPTYPALALSPEKQQQPAQVAKK